MIAAQTPAGKKGYLLRGIFTPRGKVRIATASVTSPTGDKVFWDMVTSSAGFAAEVLPSYVSGAGASSNSIQVVTNSPTAATTGGVGAVSFSWEKTDGLESWSIERRLTASPSFIANAVPAGEVSTATFTVTATDAAGRTATATVFAQAQNYGGLGGPIP